MKKLDPNHSAGYLTNYAARLFAQAIYRELRPHGISRGQLAVFFALADGGTRSQKALTQAASIEQPSMAETLSRMQKEGLVHRQTDPQDRRRLLYSLTPAALEKIGPIQRAVKKVNALAASQLTEEQKTSFLESLRIIVRTMQEHAGLDQKGLEPRSGAVRRKAP